MSHAEAQRGVRRADFVALTLGGLIIIGLLLRFWQLGVQSVWLDELWTAVATDPAIAFAQMMDTWVLPDVHPPLYYVLFRG